MLGYSLKTFKKIEIIYSVFYDHNGKKLEINSRRKTEKATESGNNIHLKKQWAKEKLHGKLEKP